MQVALLGTGLIGGSVGMALRAAGHVVIGFDRNLDAAQTAVEVGACDRYVERVIDAVVGCDLAIVAVPLSAESTLVLEALRAGAPAVTDVGSVKHATTVAVCDEAPELAARYVGGHPMAGSEQEGIGAARPDLFSGAVWILTPHPDTDPDVFAVVQHCATECGAETIAVSPQRHDELVALVSHVPQIASTTLMNVAAHAGSDDGILLRLAAGGFRDMTRIAASNPVIWPDICIDNREAILRALDAYERQLALARTLIESQDRAGLHAMLTEARHARQNLPRGFAVAGPVAEVRVPVPDRLGVLAEVTTVAGELGINIGDLEIAHSIEGDRGVLVVLVAHTQAQAFVGALHERGYRPAVVELDS
ncbi:MAG: prephenate dehydrogenase/arogenate dehydrogenase family protein [Acidimicrobiia bacterium]